MSQEQPQYIHGTAPAEQARLILLNRLTNPSFLAFLDLRGDEDVLEIGSGLGILAAQVAERLPRGRVVALERSPEQLAKAPHGIANLLFVQGEGEALPLPSASFDVVYCRYLLEHVRHPERVLQQAQRVLKPGGRIVVQENDISLVRHDPPTPAFDQLWRKFARLQEHLGGDAYIGRRLFGLLARAGFAEIELSFAPEIYGQGSEAFVPWLENLVGNVESARAALIERGLATQAQVDAAIAELRGLEADPFGSTGFAWNRAAGRKPG